MRRIIHNTTAIAACLSRPTRSGAPFSLNTGLHLRPPSPALVRAFAAAWDSGAHSLPLLFRGAADLAAMLCGAHRTPPPPPVASSSPPPPPFPRRTLRVCWVHPRGNDLVALASALSRWGARPPGLRLDCLRFRRNTYVPPDAAGCIAEVGGRVCDLVCSSAGDPPDPDNALLPCHASAEPR